MIKHLSYIVHQVMADLGETDSGNYEKYLQWAIFVCSTELHAKYSDKLKTVYLPVSALKVIDLPPDYLSYVALGTCYRGRIITLSLDNRLCLPRKTDDCGDIGAAVAACDCNNVTQDGIFSYTWAFAPHWRSGQYVGEAYGLGGGWNTAYFREDRDRNQIVLAGTVPGNEVILEYKSSGIEPDGNVLVNSEILNCLRTYIHWQRIEYLQNIPMGEKERKREQYLVELEKLADIKSSFTVDEYLDMFYRNTNSSIKRIVRV